MLHFHIAHDTASSSNSMTAYFDSASVRHRKPACTKCHILCCPCCCIIKPKPGLLASVHSLVGLFTSKNASAGAVMRHSLMLAIAASCSGVHKNSFLVQRSGRRRAKSLVIVLVPDACWLTSPVND